MLILYQQPENEEDIWSLIPRVESRQNSAAKSLVITVFDGFQAQPFGGEAGLTESSTRGKELVNPESKSSKKAVEPVSGVVASIRNRTQVLIRLRSSTCNVTYSSTTRRGPHMSPNYWAESVTQNSDTRNTETSPFPRSFNSTLRPRHRHRDPHSPRRRQSSPLASSRRPHLVPPAQQCTFLFSSRVRARVFAAKLCSLRKYASALFARALFASALAACLSRCSEASVLPFSPPPPPLPPPLHPDPPPRASPSFPPLSAARALTPLSFYLIHN